MRVLTGALCAATMMCAVPASAATLVQTASSSNGPAYVNQLDPGIGTLNRVTVTSSFFYDQYFRYPFQLGAPVIAASGFLGGTDVGQYDFTGSYQSFTLNPETIGIRLAGSAMATTTTNFSGFSGNGSVMLFGFLSDTASFMADGVELTRANLSFPFQSGGSFTVTYDYTSAVPEPATWALMLAGFAMVGFAMRRRRSATAPEYLRGL